MQNQDEQIQDLINKFFPTPGSLPLYSSPVRERAVNIAQQIESKFGLKTKLEQKGQTWEIYPDTKIDDPLRIEIIQFCHIAGFILAGAKFRK